MPWWVKFLRACSRQCRNNLHIDSTYLQTYTEDNVQYTHTYAQYTQCTFRHTYSYQYTSYVHILHYVHKYTYNNMRRCNRLYISWIRNVMDVHWMVSSGSRYVVVLVQCVRVVQLNCVKVKVQCMAPLVVRGIIAGPGLMTHLKSIWLVTSFTIWLWNWWCCLIILC